MAKHNGEDLEIDGPPTAIIGRMQQNVEDTADVALARTAALYEAIIGHTNEIARIAAKRRITEEESNQIAGYGQTIDELKFLTKETIQFLQKACQRIDQAQQQIADMEALRVVKEASKSAQGRAQ